jgi:Tfp pilus assembly protein PilF
MRLISLIFIAIFLASCASLKNDNKEKATLYVQMGISQLENEDFPNALKSFLEAEKLDPNNAVVQNNLGLTFFLRERYDLSESHFRKALSLEPRFTDARNNLARVLIEEKKYAEAEKELKIVLNDLTYNGFAKAYVNLGLSKFNQGRFQDALAAFDKSVDLEHDNCIANTYYGRSLFELKDYEKASHALDRAISFCQKQLYDEPHYYSALTYFRLGQKEKSIARFEEILKLYPNGKYRDKARAMLDLIRKGAAE